MSSEVERLRAVDRFKKLDAGISHDLDEITKLIGLLCEKPIVIISLIDDKLQWFKSGLGIGNAECNDRNVSFCNHTIQQDELLIVPDALQDTRFAQLPVVTEQPYIRFYAGVPLTTFDSHAVGTLCVLDVKPGQLTAKQATTMKVLAKQVANLFELNWSLQALMHQHT